MTVVNKKSRKSMAPLLLALAIVAYVAFIQWFFGWQKVWAAWRDIPLWKPACAIVLMFFTYVVRGWRTYDFFLPLTRGRLLTCCKIMLSHNLLNTLLPARAGEASFPLLMRTYFGTSIAYTTSGLLLLRLLDLQVLLCILALALMAYHGLPHWMWWWLPPLVLSPLLLLPLAPWLKRQLPRVRSPKLHHLLQQLITALPAHRYELFRSWLQTWICWGSKIVVFAIVFRWFAEIDFWGATGAVIGGELSSVLPIHAPGGLGTYEAGIVAAAKLMGIHGKLLFASVQLHLLMLVSTLIGGAIALLIKDQKPDADIKATV